MQLTPTAPAAISSTSTDWVDPVQLATTIANVPTQVTTSIVAAAVKGISAGHTSITPAELLAAVDPAVAAQLLAPLLMQANDQLGFDGDRLVTAVQQAATGVAELISAAATDTQTQLPLTANLAGLSNLVAHLTGGLALATNRLAAALDPLESTYRA
jgi:hypothetical protein